MTDQVRRQFGPVAEAYALSSFHARGPDLARLVTEAAFGRMEVVLDLGCGAGHTALASATLAARVIGIDVTPEMVGMASALAEQHEIRNLWFQVANAEWLPFLDRSFDVVTSRVSAHHFGNVPKALIEASRVLAAGC